MKSYVKVCCNEEGEGGAGTPVLTWWIYPWFRAWLSTVQAQETPVSSGAWSCVCDSPQAHRIKSRKKVNCLNILSLGHIPLLFSKAYLYSVNVRRCYASWAEHLGSQFIILTAKYLKCAQKPYHHLRKSGVSEGGHRGGMGVLSWPLRANCTPFFQTPCSVVAHDESDQAGSIYKMWKSVDATNEGFLIPERGW